MRGRAVNQGQLRGKNLNGEAGEEEIQDGREEVGWMEKEVSCLEYLVGKGDVVKTEAVKRRIGRLCMKTQDSSGQNLSPGEKDELAAAKGF